MVTSLELIVPLLGSEVCNHRRATAGWHPRQVDLPTAVHEKNIAAIFSADTRSLYCCDAHKTVWKTSFVYYIPLVTTITLNDIFCFTIGQPSNWGLQKVLHNKTVHKGTIVISGARLLASRPAKSSVRFMNIFCNNLLCVYSIVIVSVFMYTVSQKKFPPLDSL